MKISITKREGYEIMVARTPTMFSMVERWHGLMLLRDAHGQEIIARENVDASGARLFGSLCNDMARTACVVSVTPGLLGLLDEDMSGETVKTDKGSEKPLATPAAQIWGDDPIVAFLASRSQAIRDSEYAKQSAMLTQGHGDQAKAGGAKEV